MKSNRIVLWILIMSVLALSVWYFTSQESYIPRTGEVKVKTHDDIERKDLYCKYKVLEPLPEGAIFKAGDIICIYCAPDQNACDDFTTIVFNEKEYKVKEMDKGLPCNQCPKGTDTPPGFPTEEAK